MSAITGKSGVVKVCEDGGTPADVAQVKSYSITQTAETADFTSMGDNSRQYVSTMLTWEGSVDVVYDFHDNVSGSDLVPGTAIDLELYPDGTVGKYSGNAIVTSFEVSADSGDVVQATMNFQGTGDLTRTPE